MIIYGVTQPVDIMTERQDADNPTGETWDTIGQQTSRLSNLGRALYILTSGQRRNGCFRSASSGTVGDDSGGAQRALRITLLGSEKWKVHRARSAQSSADKYVHAIQLFTVNC